MMGNAFLPKETPPLLRDVGIHGVAEFILAAGLPDGDRKLRALDKESASISHVGIRNHDPLPLTNVVGERKVVRNVRACGMVFSGRIKRLRC
jgi:hypothetical protein